MGLSCSRFKKAVCSNCFVSMILWFSFFSNENTLQFDMFLYLSVVYPTSVEYNCSIVIIAVKVMKMEWIVCILAATLAGIGTGLVGLSAAPRYGTASDHCTCFCFCGTVHQARSGYHYRTDCSKLDSWSCRSDPVIKGV